MKSATYLLSILYQQKSSTISYTQMIQKESSFILKEVISFQKYVKNKSVMMELIPAHHISVFY